MRPFTVRSRSGKPKYYGVVDIRLNDRTATSGQMFMNAEIVKCNKQPVLDGSLELVWPLHKAGKLIQEIDPSTFVTLEECGVVFLHHEDGTLMGFFPAVRDTTMDRKEKWAYRNVNPYLLVQALKQKLAEEWVFDGEEEVDENDRTLVTDPIEYADEAEPIEYEDETVI